jgi:hypothetical protein
VPDKIDGNKVSLTEIKVTTGHVGGFWIFAVVCAAAVVFIYILVVSGGKPSDFVLGADNRYSNSKFQMTVWFGVVGVAYVTTLLLRLWFGYLGGVDLPAHLLTLIGISGVSGGGAKATTSLKNAAAETHNAQADAAAAAAPGNPAPALKPTKTVAQTSPRFWHDLTHNDKGEWDMGDVQMLLVTAIAVIAFAIAMIEYWSAGIKLVTHDTLPDVDVGLTALFGTGLGAYLVKKISAKPGEA